MLLRVARQVVAAVGLTDALGALSRLNIAPVDYETALFHDEELDGPLPSRVRTVVLTSDERRPVVVARTEGFADLDVVSADDVPDSATKISGVRPEQQLATVAVRLEMTAVYLRLVRG